MKENLTDITVLIDQSGSMNSRRNEVIGGFNSFLQTHKAAPGEAMITLVLFDSVNSHEIVYSARPVCNAPDLNYETFVPRGGTPLYDAFARAIIDTGARLSLLPEGDRPSKVIFVVVTDGYENMSREFTASALKDMVKHQIDKYSWDFVFLGADIDAMTQGEVIGLNAGSTVSLAAANMSQAFGMTAHKTATYRSSNNKADLNYSIADRDALATDQKPVPENVEATKTLP